MAKYFADNSLSIGNTPLVRINRMARGLKATVLAKSRDATRPIRSNADRRQHDLAGGKDRPSEARGGDRGAHQRQHGNRPGLRRRCPRLQAHRHHARDRFGGATEVLAAFGANLTLTPGAKGMSGAIQEAERILLSNPGAFMPNQFKNPANPEIHFRTTGPEVWEQTGGQIDVLVSGVGTGGTISGISRFIKKRRNAPSSAWPWNPGKARSSPSVLPARS